MGCWNDGIMDKWINEWNFICNIRVRVMKKLRRWEDGKMRRWEGENTGVWEKENGKERKRYTNCINRIFISRLVKNSKCKKIIFQTNKSAPRPVLSCGRCPAGRGGMNRVRVRSLKKVNKRRKIVQPSNNPFIQTFAAIISTT